MFIDHCAGDNSITIRRLSLPFTGKQFEILTFARRTVQVSVVKQLPDYDCRSAARTQSISCSMQVKINSIYRLDLSKQEN